MNRLRSLNKMMVFFVFFIMLFAGILTSLLFFILYVMGVSAFFVFTPILSPLIALLVSSIIGTFLSAIVGERVLKPLNQLIKATQVISMGDFSVRVEEINGTSEIADLLRGFNHMAEELGSIEFFRKDFINDFSHEFKTPITSIMGFAKQLRNEDLSPEKRKEYTTIIVSESERLTNLSRNILLLNNLDNQQIITDQNEYELDEQIRHCVILLEKEWTEKNLEVDLCLEPVIMYGNAEMLSHIWLNLIDNAIKYSNDMGHISIMCNEVAGYIRFVIANDGNGMDAATLKHIFEKFYQGDKSHATRGNGLGLSIAKRIVDIHKGKISVESRPGQGATVTVWLPKRRQLEET